MPTSDACKAPEAGDAVQEQGFVRREHRREKKVGDKVQSVAEYDEVAQAARTATYVSIDYPVMFDMLRLRLHLAKKHAVDQIDDGNVRCAHAAAALVRAAT
jgi:hypothetical protein